MTRRGERRSGKLAGTRIIMLGVPSLRGKRLYRSERGKESALFHASAATRKITLATKPMRSEDIR